MRFFDLSSPAHILTFLRVCLVPLLILSEKGQKNVFSLILLIVVVLSDIFDGMLARRMKKMNGFGAVFDMTADVLVVGALYIFLYRNGTLPLLLVILMFVSFSSFSTCCVIKKEVVKNTIGQYTGAVLMAGLLCIFSVRCIFKEHYYVAVLISAAVSSLYLLSSTIENIALLIRTVKDKRPVFLD